MEKKIFKKVLAILTIVMIMATDFFVLGSNLISYAATLDSSTNNENIEFSAYFKNESGTRVDNINESIKKEELKMYAEIKVKNEGYFNGAIELQESNFKIKNNILSSDISSIEENKVNLKQINAGATVEIELDIEPVISETIKSDMLSMNSTIKLTGQYMETTYKGLNIEATKTIKANFEVDESASAELITDIITNDVISLNETNKRIVQLLIKSRLSDNQYPVSQTTLEVEVPQLSSEQPEEVKLLALGTKATNGKEDYSIEDYKNENGKLQITLENEPDGENNITWNKNVYDEIVVTLIYSEDVDANVVEIKTTSEMTLYNSASTYTAEYTKGIENKTLNNTIITQVESNSADIYKGQLYANTKSEEKKDIEYKTKTTLKIITTELADKVIIHEGPDVFVTDDLTELTANTKFLSTEINKEKMLAILGENATIQINDGETIHSITKDTESNESGNIVINYTTALSELDVITSKPEKTGILEFNHTKVITENAYTVEKLRTINQLKLKDTVKGSLGENNVVENSTEASLELKETITKAELTVNKENLSTMTSNNEVILGIELITNGEQYDLYKNPTITIQLPSSVESIKTNSISPLYTEGFELKPEYNPTNKTLNITLIGEQLTYPEQAKQIYLQINLDMTLLKLAPSKTEKIVMTYTNENATQYAGGRTDMGVIEKEINIISPSGLIPVNNIETYDIEGIGGISQDKQVANIDKNTAGGTDVKFDVTLVNNTKSDVNNVKILGILPTSGEFTYGTETIKNTFTTTLKSAITAPNATVYYTNNMNATSDINDTNNGWKQNLAEVPNPRAYLIVIPTITNAGTFSTTYTVTLPSTLDYDLTSYAGYQVIYNEGTDTAVQKVQSTLVGITTGQGVKLESTLSATVGNETLNSGDTVKAGEVIRYTATVKNNGTQTLENVVIKCGVPEGTVYVIPDEGDAEDINQDDQGGINLGYQYTGAEYYLEKVDVKEISENIDKLEVGQEAELTYEVRVNSSTQIKNKSTAIYDEYSINSNEITNNIENSNIRATIKCIVDKEVVITPGEPMLYAFFIENLGDTEINNIEAQINLEGVNIITVEEISKEETKKMEVLDQNKIVISKIPAKSNVFFRIVGQIEPNFESAKATIKVTDSNNNTYRSNISIENIKEAGADITLTSPNNGEFVNIGEKIEYVIEIKNTGEFSTTININSKFSEYLKITEVYVNDEIKMQTLRASDKETYIFNIGNDFTYGIQLLEQENATITVIAKVKQTDEQFETQIIKNSAKAVINGEVCDVSDEVSHIIKGNVEADIKNIISGIAWIDENQDGQRQSGEKLLSGINVKLFDISTNTIAKDKDGNTAESTTNDNGEYIFTKIENGQYIVLFEFDQTQYELTEYKKEGIQENQNSNAILKSFKINGEEKTYGVTDTITISESISNINIGLKEKLIYDLELNKYISRIVVQTSKNTKTYEYNDSVFQKVEIHSKELKNAMVILEYTIKVNNAGEIVANVNSIIDYLPAGLEFSSELNPDWYLSGENLHTKSLTNDKIQPGETRELKLILTKKMTENNVGLINNRAEIEECFNDFGKEDIDSTPNNLIKGEDDLGAADVIISISTGAKTIGYIVLITINTGLIAFAIYLIFKRNRKIK